MASAWGLSWGGAWGNAWGVISSGTTVQPGGGPAQKYDKGLRAYADEWWALRYAKKELAKVDAPAPKKLVKQIKRYQSDQINLDQFRRETEALIFEIRSEIELKQELEKAAQEIEAFIQDEQEALDFLLLDDGQSRALMLQVM